MTRQKGVSDKIRGTLFRSPYSKDPTIWGAILGSPIFGNSQKTAIVASTHRVRRHTTYQYPLIKEYTLNHMRDPFIVSGIFLS